jgi:DNA-binding transcriptional regulator GbsR (MarR family)
MDTSRPISDPDPEAMAFVEDVAVFFETEGLPKTVGRVIGWLLICDPPEQSPAQLAEALDVSRSSISSATRMLTPSGLVERVGLRGHREDYYRIRPDAWAAMLRRRAERTTDFRALTKRGLDILGDAEPSRRTRLERVDALYRFLEHEMPAVFERWEATRDDETGEHP